MILIGKQEREFVAYLSRRGEYHDTKNPALGVSGFHNNFICEGTLYMRSQTKYGVHVLKKFIMLQKI